MLTLQSTNTIGGVADTAAAITCTITGADGSAPNYQVLAQSQLAAVASNLFTATSRTLVKTIHLANTSAVDITGVKMFVNGLVAANQLTGSFMIPANGWATYDEDGWRVYDSNGAIKTSGATGPAGVQGSPGPAIFLAAEDGEEGFIGPPGAPGAAGANGTPGAAGAVGAMGPQGPPGEDGDVGPPGPPGVDAMTTGQIVALVNGYAMP